jgi:hypothetical protein
MIVVLLAFQQIIIYEQNDRITVMIIFILEGDRMSPQSSL